MLFNEKVEHPDFNQLKILLEQLLQDMLAISVLNGDQRTSIAENFRQIEVLLEFYPQQQDKADLEGFNDIDIEEKMSQLITDIKTLCYQHKQAFLYHQCNEWYLAYHLWRTSNQYMINLLEALVNSLAEIANVFA